MRLTADLILRSGSYLNPLKERELNLRGNKLAVIENLGATQDQFDCIDLSDNEIGKLEGFPLLQRLRTLLLNNNKISKIGSLGEALPELHTLVLTNNKLNALSDLDPLAELPSLTHLSLLDNIISKKQNYRSYVIFKLPKLKVLDFKKIKQKERATSESLFGKPVLSSSKDKTGQAAAATGKANSTSNGTTGTTTTSGAEVGPSGLTMAQVHAVKIAITTATSLEEVAVLERALATGQLPASLLGKTASEGNNNNSSANPDAMVE